MISLGAQHHCCSAGPSAIAGDLRLTCSCNWKNRPVRAVALQFPVVTG